MKVLLINKFYYRRGGAEVYVLEMEKKLRQAGHEVAIFSMDHPKNLPSSWSHFFVTRVSFNEGGLLERFRAVARMFYSFEARRNLKLLLSEFKPDIIHIHNIYHQISPSILPLIKKLRIPIVMHLHDYKIISPNYSLYDGQRICEDCALPHYWRCFFKKCFGNSYVKSFLVCLETFFHHRILNIYDKNIDCYLAPSQFMKEICVRHGLSEDKIVVIYNFFIESESKVIQTKEKNYFLFLGRLSQEKGIANLLKAVALVPESQLVIAGTGPEKLNLERMVTTLSLSNRVKFLGYLEGEKLQETIRGAQAIVIPSVWLENMPFVLLEVLSEGKVVIASRMGGLQELIKDGENGFLYNLHDIHALANALSLVEDLSPVMRKTIEKKAQESTLDFSLEQHYNRLMAIYGHIIGKVLPFNARK